MEDNMDIKKILKKLPGAWVLATIVLVWVAFFASAKYIGHARTLRPIALWVTIILIVVWAIVLVLALLKAKKERDSKQMLDASAGSGKIKNLEEKLIFAIRALRQSKVGKVVGKADAQYAVPWYMLIGPIGSGKTNLLTKSGLDFRLRDPSATDVPTGPTKDCNWMFANEAVVMDTTGRYITQPDKSVDKAEWLAFLDHLKKHRKVKPMDGVIKQWI
jgi:type VI secretion system protein ImpL